MSMTQLSLATTIILLFPMLYFLFSSLTFFLARLSDPTVTWLLRGLFNTYFRVVGITGAIATVAFAGAGRPEVALGLGVLVAASIVARSWFLHRMDAELRARDAGDTAALRKLRRLHVGAIMYNAVQVSAVVACLPLVFPSV